MISKGRKEKRKTEPGPINQIGDRLGMDLNIELRDMVLMNNYDFGETP